MTAHDDTTPLNPNRIRGENTDQSYSTFNNKTPFLSETEEPFTDHDDESIENASTESSITGSKQFLGSPTSIIMVLLLGILLHVRPHLIISPLTFPGEFISNMDSTIVVANAGPISSEFNRLQDASWLSTAFSLGIGSVQLLYGKLSIIFGCKPILLLAYFLLALGCLICGLAPSMSIIIIGRVVSGMGGAGIMSMGSIIILDVVPKRDLASWRAIINISMTLGRSIGGPTGGWLTDTIGWRWIFLTQTPMLGIAAILAIIFLQYDPNSIQTIKDSKPSIRRVDIPGGLLLASSVVSITLLIDRGGKSFSWSSQQALLLATCGILFFAAFAYYERHIAIEPIFDFGVLKLPNVSTCYLIAMLQIGAQSSMMYTVPLYFQVTAKASATVAGSHLAPSVIGNAVGGLAAGWFIRRTGHYKPVLFIAGLVASITYLLLYLRWNGDTSIWESLFIFPGGMGTAFASAASFVALTAFLDSDEVIMATSGYMLAFSIAMTAGITTTNSVLTTMFKRNTLRDLKVPNADEIIRRSLENSHFISNLTGEAREIVVKSYIGGLRATYRKLLVLFQRVWTEIAANLNIVMSLCLSLAGSILGLTIRDHKL
ncbi:uncharacterized protein N7469_006336 [Penicillium citrinum]|uniref:Major facilitator superfamily (MFS) profile domain-containing protein n=1 Tax=Penicillium citrinum TaxID=5077 RepID=A0A9W9P0H5_PENCI|nr:uncharacterized protein N7469_006336 [Penicillium citrinum]KAJ5231748.1 hypothetical protein N7469_006336 [Penicillium citrinum]